ncbi:hypothetical protein OPV22_014043 [Ensete ventricosum]|uniref:Uncharacterized protein n=1 Tax=Ensete ventricosum TaxID=4639 RepID=A0AAV8QWX3_ENSVE|nr:hypothetical protein OPV22_014043 [Ensete ventricosum]
MERALLHRSVHRPSNEVSLAAERQRERRAARVDKPAGEDGKIDDMIAAGAADLRPRVEEVPEAGAVGQGMVDGAPNEHLVGELDDLDAEKWQVVAVVAQHSVEGQEREHDWWTVDEVEYVRNLGSGGGGVDELGSQVVALEGDGMGRGRRVVLYGDEATSQESDVEKGSKLSQILAQSTGSTSHGSHVFSSPQRTLLALTPPSSCEGFIVRLPIPAGHMPNNLSL